MIRHERRRWRRRGSTILYALAVVTVVTLLVGVNLDLTGSLRRRQQRSEQETVTEYLKIAAQSTFREHLLTNPTSALVADTMTVCGVSYDLSYSSASTTGAFLISVKRDGTTLCTTEGVDPRGAQPQLYGLWAKSFDTDKKLVVGDASTTTHAYFGAQPVKDPVSGSLVYGAIDTASADPLYKSTGLVTTGVVASDPVPCEQISWTPAEFLNSSQTINGRSASNVLTLGRSYLIVVGGTTTVTGTFSGKITIFSKNNLTIKTPLIVTPGSELVLMTDADTNVQGQGEVDCHLYTSGKFSIPASSTPINWNGSIVGKEITIRAPLNLTLDPYFYSDPDLLSAFYLPKN